MGKARLCPTLVQPNFIKLYSCKVDIMPFSLKYQYQLKNSVYPLVTNKISNIFTSAYKYKQNLPIIKLSQTFLSLEINKPEKVQRHIKVINNIRSSRREKYTSLSRKRTLSDETI